MKKPDQRRSWFIMAVSALKSFSGCFGADFSKGFASLNLFVRRRSIDV